MITHNQRSKLQRSVRGFLVADSGSVTVEFALMVPLFTGLLMLMTDASMLYLQQSKLLNVSRDTARIVARYAMTAVEAKAYAESVASNGRGTATAKVTIANGFVTVTVSSPSKVAAPFGIIKFAVGDTLTAATTNTMEPA
ncbi:MAG: TadE/TadG family type IV pilus assembly protein [Tabrizicola sp.]|uniref:TadE/TadG family type IV pilus assembly protein n=1 Tax=Tabrizicola sp. TaxID=2005166 RepID=UPI0027351661|nr:TadE/TadG family type IV pilus assembly protein [Tabrizicola sp.]MDP3262874.1 TadE/TadG family type IV pilus assembly protein [Tabrizicola sp.]MDP3649071.1 TadE/TadG family type IV pilus assembly protein [Paracoccaceae bacterium]MDZ4066138.1 TadE/TadG family type IV pilus assembly protein [Tabrizicola sp.]